MPDPFRRRGVPSLALLLALAAPAAAQPPAEQRAAELLARARKAYNEGDPRHAADGFAEFLKDHGSRAGANDARLGLALALLDLPDPDYKKAAEVLAAPAGDGGFSDRPLALYYLGTCDRAFGLKEVEAGLRNPGEAVRRRDAASGHFAAAGAEFARAREAFEKRAADGDAEWAARARCDGAEAALRLGKPKEARDLVEPLVKGPAPAKGASRPLGLYYHGFACFLAGDVPAAGRSLGAVAPFDQPFGPHARYLLGRVHQLEGENAEAAVAFDAVLAEYDRQKKAAEESLKQPDRFKNDPWEKARLEALTRGPAPDYVAGATFHAACLNYEAGKFGEALAKFQAFAKDFAASPLAADALLRAGFCMVQARQYDEAVKLLGPLGGQHARLADQAAFWLGKAQLGRALAIDPGNAAGRLAALKEAAATLKAAAARAGQPAGEAPGARERRVEVQLEAGDALMAAGEYREAAEAYEVAWREKPPPARAEEVLQRTVAALQLTGVEWATAARVAEFKQKFPQGTLLPSVLFHEAESLADRGAAQAKAKDAAGARETYGKAVATYEGLIAKYPEFDRAGRAKYGLALCLAERDEWEKAATVLEGIRAADRVGEAAAVPFLLADCLIRTAPARADDALQDNVLREKLGNAAALLEGFVAANPKAPEAAEALLKLGYCRKRIGIQLADPKEKNEALNGARAALDRVRKEYPASPAVGPAVLERAKVSLLLGDRGGAMENLKAFAHDPLKSSPVAPLAAVALAAQMREQNQAAAAAAMLKEARARFEPQLAADPQRLDWANLLKYQHGAALLEAGAFAEARQVLEPVCASAYNKPIGVEAALKAEQAQAGELRKRLAEAEKERNKPGLPADQVELADRRVRGAVRELIEHGRHMERRADGFKAVVPAPEARARLIYDAAWLYRSLAAFAPLNPHGRPATDGERDGKDPLPKDLADATALAYAHLIAAFPDAALAVDARFELAELLADGGKPGEAVKLLKEALDKEPADRPVPPETIERVRLRLGAALFDAGDHDAARAQFEAVAQNAKSPLRGQAMYRAAECFLAQGKPTEAKERLKPFRDDGTMHNVAGVSDRALLRLGHAYAELKSWESSRQAFEALLGRYGGSPWKADAHYGAGGAYQNQGRFDEAANHYGQVTALRADDLAGRAHLQLGECRMAQKRYGEAVKAFLVVAYGYDDPDLKFAALLEAARALAEDKKSDEAGKLLAKVLRDAPAEGPWAKAARERLDKLKK